MRVQKGFTLIELMVTISIVAILAAIGMVVFSSAQGTARDAKIKEDMEDLKKAFYIYKTANGTFCTNGKGSCGAGTSYGCWDFWTNSNPDWGFNSTTNQSYSLKKNILPYLKAVPTTDFVMQACGDDHFIISAKLQTPPSPAVTCTIGSGGAASGPYPMYSLNYCISE